LGRKRSQPSANLPVEVDRAIKEFLSTKAAQRLGIKSKDEFVKRACLAVLIRYKVDYQMLARLFDIEEADLKNAKVEDLE
jgi:hypothetical protein